MPAVEEAKSDEEQDSERPQIRNISERNIEDREEVQILEPDRSAQIRKQKCDEIFLYFEENWENMVIQQCSQTIVMPEEQKQMIRKNEGDGDKKEVE